MTNNGHGMTDRSYDSGLYNRRNFIRGVGAAGATVLAGCGGSGGEQTTAGENEGATTGNPKGNDTLTLTLWSKLGGGDGRAMVEMVKTFNQQHDNVQIERTRIPSSNFFSKMYTALTGGNAPDIATMNKVPLFRNKEYFHPFGEYLDIDLQKEYFAPALNAGKFNGKYYSLPLDQAATVMYYNKDHFAAAGLDPENPPSNHQEFVNACKSIEKNTEYYPFTPATYGNPLFISIILYKMMKGAGGHYLKGKPGNYDVAWDSEIGVKAAEWINNVPERGWDERSMANQRGVSGWRNGKKFSMVHNGTWFYGPAKQSDVNWGSFVPKFSPYAERNVEFTFSNLLSVPMTQLRKHSDEEHTKAAVKASKWLTHRLTWPLVAGHVPGYKAALNSSKLRNSDVWKKLISTLIPLAKTDRLEYFPAAQPQYKKPLNTQLEKMYLGRISAETALTKAAKQSQTKLDR